MSDPNQFPLPNSVPSQPSAAPTTKVTPLTLQDMKRHGEKIACLTAYDFPFARLLDQSGIDLLLVGDSWGMAVAGEPNTLAVTLDEMILCTRMVRRGCRRALLVADMPFGTFQVSREETVHNALRLVREGGAEAVKLEGGERRAHLVHALVDAEVPVVGHIGLTPQSVLRIGGYRVQGRDAAAIDQLHRDAVALAGAGACALVLEGVPRELAASITEQLSIPTIGIGAGPDCDGQILVLHDLLGLTVDAPAKFVRRFAHLDRVVQDAVGQYRHQVQSGGFPSDQESYHLPTAVRDLLAPKRSGR